MLVEDSSVAAAPPGSAPAPKLFVVANPGSGASDAEATRALLADVFAQAKREVEFVPVASPDELVPACKRAALRAANEGGVLVAVGGDGTINTVAQEAHANGCPLGVIPQGTFNFFGRNHGISQDVREAASALLRAESVPVQVGFVNEALFLVNASLGLYPQLLHDREQFKSKMGRRRWVALLSGLYTLFEWRRQLTLDIELEGERATVLTPTLFVGNNRLQLDRIGLPAETTAQVGSGRLAGVVVRPIGTLAMLGLAIRGGLGRLGDAESVDSFAFRSMTVRPGRAPRAAVAIDGEIRWMTSPLRFAVAQRPLILMQPREQDRVAVE
jgi:diacylglycerol kinase family enzyme